MEQDIQGRNGGTVTMVPPPSYQEPKNKTKPFLIAIVTMTLATLFVVSFCVFHLIVKGQSPGVVNNVTTNDNKPVVITRDVSFQMSDGVPRHEQMRAAGNKLTIDNSNDGYTVVFDYDMDLAVFKNRTTSSCHFTRLSDIHVEMKMDNLSSNLPVFFTENPGQNKALLEDSDVTVLTNLQPIPAGYLEVTSAEICADGLSFWIEPTEVQEARYTRGTKCDTTCKVIIVAVALSIFG